MGNDKLKKEVEAGSQEMEAGSGKRKCVVFSSEQTINIFTNRI
jgi:hypothetical protein